MKLSARGAQKTRDDSKKLQMYSKQWLPGDNMRIWFPVFKQDGLFEISVGAIWGHKVNDFEGIGLKSTFIPSLTQFDENGDPIGQPDITYQFSLIAKAFIDGQKAIEERNIQNKKWPSDSARTEALRALEEKYDVKNNMKAIKPAIARASYYITTEVICCKVVNEIPVLDTLAVVSFPLASQRIDQLYTILRTPKYAPEDDETFFEVEWKYPTNADKGASARAANPTGLTREYRIAHTNPDQWKTIQSMFNLISDNDESMVRRATRKIDEAKIRGALTRYSFINSEYLDSAPEDSIESLVKHADVIHELDVTRTLNNTELIEKINASFAEMQANAVSTAATQTDAIPDLSNMAQQVAAVENNVTDQIQTPQQPVDLAAQAQAAAAKTDSTFTQTAGTTPVADTQHSSDLLNQAAATQPVDIGPANANAPSINELMTNNNYVDMEESELEEIDLSGM